MSNPLTGWVQAVDTEQIASGQKVRVDVSFNCVPLISAMNQATGGSAVDANAIAAAFDQQAIISSVESVNASLLNWLNPSTYDFTVTCTCVDGSVIADFRQAALIAINSWNQGNVTPCASVTIGEIDKYVGTWTAVTGTPNSSQPANNPGIPFAAGIVLTVIAIAVIWFLLNRTQVVV